MLSSESENEGQYEENHQNDLYFKKYKLLAERCVDIQKRNQRLAFRIQEVNKITKRRNEQVRFMKDRLLTEYGEDWTVIPKYFDLNLDEEDKEEDVKLVIHKAAMHKFKEEKREDLAVTIVTADLRNQIYRVQQQFGKQIQKEQKRQFQLRERYKK